MAKNVSNAPTRYTTGPRLPDPNPPQQPPPPLLLPRPTQPNPTSTPAMPSLELADRLDRQAQGGYVAYGAPTGNGSGVRSPKAGNREDLIFHVENGDGTAAIAPPPDPSDEYFGLEQELEFRLARRRRNRYVAVGALFLAFVAGIISLRTGEDVEEDISKYEKIHHQNRPTASPGKSPTSSFSSGATDVDEGMEELGQQASLWPTPSPPAVFEICAPPIYPDLRGQKKSHQPVFHMLSFATVPEAPSRDDPSVAWDEQWQYAFSALDLSDDASIIAVGLDDFSSDTDYDVGMVRTFAYDCSGGGYSQLGQDLRGSNGGEQFGNSISSSSDGRTMAVSAPSDSYDDGDGFVDVFYLDDSSDGALAAAPRWVRLGDRIDDLDSSVDYDRVGHAIDLSSRGDTLAILGIVDTNSYLIRVYRYSKSKGWALRGKKISVTVNFADEYEFAPQLSLSDDGDELSFSDPEFGVTRYVYKWQTSKWTKVGAKGATFANSTAVMENDPDVDSKPEGWYINQVATDRNADVIAYTAWGWNKTEAQYEYQAFQLVDYSTAESPVELYNFQWTDYAVGVNTAVAQDGGVAAVVVSKTDVDDDEFWADEEVVGSMYVLSKGAAGPTWSIVGEGTDAEGMGVPGSFVSLSGDGRIVAVGSSDTVALYGVLLPEQEYGTEVVEEEEADDAGDAAASIIPAKFDLCPPYPNATVGNSAGVLDSLPKSPDEHTISVALSSDGTIMAIGIDSYDGEDRGLARLYGWSCSNATYMQLGQDLFGGEEFDGFGQSVDLSADGKTVVVGANQPPPTKSGYVEVYHLNESGGDDGDSFEWTLVGSRISNVPNGVGDVGREVRISDDGLVVAFSGSMRVESSLGMQYDGSFVRVVRNNKKAVWKKVGDDLIGSVSFDEYGDEMHLSMSGDGSTVAVVGSYGDFLSKVYSFSADKKNWTEAFIPGINFSYEDADYDWDDDLSGYAWYDFEDDYDLLTEWSYFTGHDVALNSDGSILAVAGVGYSNTDEGAMVRVLARNSTTGNWTLSPDPVDVGSADYSVSSIDVDDAGRHIAVGLNSHSDGYLDQGALFVATAASAGDGGGGVDLSLWNSTGLVEGLGADDLLGSRVVVSSDGTLAVGSSRKGYLSFFKLG